MTSGEGWSGVERAGAEAERCAQCSRPLEPAAPRYAALFPEGDSFRRRDYCAPCFEALPERPASFWRRAPRRAARKAEEKGKRAARRRDLDALLELFERLAAPEAGAGAGTGTGTGGEREKLRYLLALALVRKKRLELVELAREGGADCLILRASGDAELVTVAAPPIAEADLARLSRELEAEIGLS